MPSPTRFPGGLTTTYSDTTLGQFLAPDPSKLHTYWEDFDYYTAADWTVTETQASATQALTDVDGGVLLLTNSAANNDLNALQKVGESFLLTSGKKAWFKARFKVSDATLSAFVIGLQVTDTTPLDVTDGIYFLKSSASTSMSAICRKNATTGSTSLTAATIANDTWLSVGWYYDGKSSVAVFVDDVQVGTLDGSSTYLPDTELTVSFAVSNGEAVAKTMSVDYILASQER